ncbi:unnamed protein product [Pleuronectes platessa]|uniref:Uncharacterized protein n=1 Tax=Pleuronectes platessa TaxID=8262 RepID=A0A9N7Y632_PLEPL|nr:unnamed protein product [Pleuronectes platessa]
MSEGLTVFSNPHKDQEPSLGSTRHPWEKGGNPKGGPPHPDASALSHSPRSGPDPWQCMKKVQHAKGNFKGVLPLACLSSLGGETLFVPRVDLAVLGFVDAGSGGGLELSFLRPITGQVCHCSSDSGTLTDLELPESPSRGCGSFTITLCNDIIATDTRCFG